MRDEDRNNNDKSKLMKTYQYELGFVYDFKPIDIIRISFVQ